MEFDFKPIFTNGTKALAAGGFYLLHGDFERAANCRLSAERTFKEFARHNGFQYDG